MHKYIDYFSEFTYDEFLKLTDSKLIDLNITLGARKRLLNNIEYINKRCNRLKQMNLLIDESFYQKNESILKELLDMSAMPMKYQNSKFTSLNSLSQEENVSKVVLNEENKEDLPSNFIFIIDKSIFFCILIYWHTN